MSDCTTPTCADEIAALETNQIELFQRTDDLAQALTDTILAYPYLVVTTAEELQEAFDSDTELIFVRGEIEYGGFYDSPKPKHLVGLSDANGLARIIYTNDYLFNPFADLRLERIVFESTAADKGICVTVGGDRFSGIVAVEKCEFETMGSAIALSGGNTSNLAPAFFISRNKFTNIGDAAYSGSGRQGVIELAWNLSTVVIEYNEFTNVFSNAVWVGQSIGSSGNVTRNRIINCQRNAVEIFNASNISVDFNYISGGLNLYGGGGMGISLAGEQCRCIGNQIYNVATYGIEVYDSTLHSNTGHIVKDNLIDGITGDYVGNPTLGMSIQNCDDAIIEGNTFKNIMYGNASARYAIQVGNCNNLSIKGNKFKEVTEGVRMLSGSNNTVTGNDFDVSFIDGGLIAGSTQPSVVIFSGTGHIVRFNNTRRLKVGNDAGAYYIAEGVQVYAHVDATLTIGAVGGTGLGNVSSNISIQGY